jgi:thiamine biosynthesis lipoprotein
MPDSEVRTYTARAMATYFQVALWGKDAGYLDAVAEECFDEIRRIEGQLSLYREDTDIYELNRDGAERTVILDPRVYRVLEEAARLSVETGGAFDITVGPLVRVWGFMGASGHMADPAAVEKARESVGMGLVELVPEVHGARFVRDGVMVDLGAIGKGYALDQMAELIRDYEIAGALVHGGTSTVVAVGGQPDGAAWNVAIQDPADEGNHIAVVPLRDCALSVSAVHGKFFTEGDARYGHVIDPRSCQPVQNALLSAVVCPSATESDALSTALLIEGELMLESLTARPDTSGLIVVPDGNGAKVMSAGPAFEGRG